MTKNWISVESLLVDPDQMPQNHSALSLIMSTLFAQACLSVYNDCIPSGATESFCSVSDHVYTVYSGLSVRLQ